MKAIGSKRNFIVSNFSLALALGISINPSSQIFKSGLC